jgi:hypothetical protein
MLQSLTGDAQGILPTFTGPADVDAHREAVNGQHQSLNAQIIASGISQDFKNAWLNYLRSWNEFYTANREASWAAKFLSAVSMYSQIDQFASQVADWASKFQQAGGQLQGGFPSLADKPTTNISDITGLVVAGGVLAAIVILGPKLVKGA